MYKTRVFNGRTYVLDGTSKSRDYAESVANGERTDGRLARVTKVGNRGLRLDNNDVRKNCYAIWVCWE